MKKQIACMAASGLVTSALAGGFVPVGIFSDIPGDPTAGVPGLATEFGGFDRPYVSPDGSLWIMSADTTLPTSEDEIILVGTTADPTNATVVVQEGTATGWDPLVNNGLIDRNMSINDNGDFAYATNTNGPTSEDEVIARFNAKADDWTLIAQEGDAIPGLPNDAYGTSLNGPSILADGKVGWLAPSTAGALPTTEDSLALLGNDVAVSIIAQEGVTTPTGSANPWQLFDTQDFYLDATGANYILQGDTTAATTEDDIVVVNGAVVLQENAPIPGAKVLDVIDGSGIVDVHMGSAGDWMSRGDFDVTDQDWLVYNGDIIALTGDAVPGGEKGETFSDAIFSACFFSMTANGKGSFVFGATTSNPDEFRDAVLVLNGKSVILRQGDAIDLDGNGELDDDTFIDVFNNDDMFLTDDMKLFFTADIMDGKNADLGQAYMMVDLDQIGFPCLQCGDSNCDGTVSVGDINFFVAAVTGGEPAWNALFFGFPPCDYLCANDTNFDTMVTVGDINGFVAAVTGGSCQ